jgi:hypothetical protein
MRSMLHDLCTDLVVRVFKFTSSNQVNRCQIEIQKSVGKPAQAHMVDDLNNETRLTRIQMVALEKRVDSLQMVLIPSLDPLQLKLNPVF